MPESNASPAETPRLTDFRRRFFFHALVFVVAWPLVSAFFAALAISEQSVAKNAAFSVITAGSFLGALKMWPEFLACGLILALLTALLFSWMSSKRIPKRFMFIEPLLFTIAAAAGLCAEYPALLRHSVFRVLRPLVVWQATIVAIVVAILLFAAIGLLVSGSRGAVRYALASSAIVLVAWVQSFVPSLAKREAPANGVVLFGIDSLAYRDDLSPLRELAVRRDGTWYTNAITPALVTNAVWSAILMNRPVSETGVYLIYQNVDWKRVPYNLVEDAEKHGFETWSFFTSQFTSYVGSRAGFDHDRSSPVGWLYIATGFIKDSSVFLPVLLPRMPRLPFALTPANQEGTFAYDLRGNVREVLIADASEKPSFVCAHFDYLHANAYPRYQELTEELRSAIRRAKVDALQDQSLDPDAPQVSGDPISLHAWKTTRIQQVLIEELESTNFFERSNRLVVFSDHGTRRGLDPKNFGAESFSHVVFLTFGVPRREARQPISLIDISKMVGLGDPRRPARAFPAVQHAGILPVEGLVLRNSIESGKRGSGLAGSGEVILDPLVVANVGRRLAAFRPFGAHPGYWQTPSATPPWALATNVSD